jgi:hypothetical protein
LGSIETMMAKRTKRKPKREKKESPPDLYALSRLLRSDRKPVGGWIEWGKNVRRKGVLAG